MQLPAPELSLFLERCHELLAAFQTVETTADRAALLASSLHRFWDTPLSACLLHEETGPFLLALGKTGPAPADWQPFLRQALGEWVAPEGRITADLPAPPVPELEGHLLHVARVACQGQTYGTLAVAVPKANGLPDSSQPTELLWLAQLLSPWFRLRTRATPTPSEPRQNLSRFVLSDLAEAVAHEFNNLLNNILLQLEVLKRLGGSEDILTKAAGLQQRCRQAAGLLTRLQRFSESAQPAFCPVAVNHLVREVAAGNVLGVRKVWARSIHLDLDEELPPLQSSPFDLTRLLALLVEHACAVTPETSGVTVRTARLQDGWQLSVEDRGAVVAADALRKLVEPFTVARPGADDWALSVCKILARRLTGTLQAANRNEEGMTFAVEFRTQREGLLGRSPSQRMIGRQG